MPFGGVSVESVEKKYRKKIAKEIKEEDSSSFTGDRKSSRLGIVLKIGAFGLGLYGLWWGYNKFVKPRPSVGGGMDEIHASYISL